MRHTAWQGRAARFTIGGGRFRLSVASPGDGPVWTLQLRGHYKMQLKSRSRRVRVGVIVVLACSTETFLAAVRPDSAPGQPGPVDQRADARRGLMAPEGAT